MNKHILRTACVCILASVFLLAGCTTPLHTPPTQAANAAYSYYLKNRQNVNVSTVAALLSYTSSHISRNPIRTWEGYDEYFEKYIQQVRKRGMVHENYPAVASKYDIRAYRRFVQEWRKECRAHRMKPAAAGRDFANSAASLIYQLLEKEYDRDTR